MPLEKSGLLLLPISNNEVFTTAPERQKAAVSDVTSPVISFLLPLSVGFYGYTKRSVDLSGAISGKHSRK